MKNSNSTFFSRQSRSTPFLSLFLALVLSGYVPMAGAAMQMFMVIDGVKGESTDPVFPESIEVKSFEWGVAKDSQSGGGGGAPSFDELTIVKKVDSSSIDFFMQVATGDHYQEALIVLRKTDSDPFEFFAFRLFDVAVTRVYTLAGDDDSGVAEQVTFDYRKIQTLYRPQNPENGEGGPLKDWCWDLQSNSGC